MKIKPILCAAMLAFTSIAYADIIRWKDSSGRYQYSDVAPSSRPAGGIERLSGQGIIKGVIDQPKTAREYSIEKEIESLRSEVGQLTSVYKHRDNVLTRTFRTAGEIEQSSKQRSESIANTKTLSETTIAETEEVLSKLLDKAGNLELEGKRVNQKISERIQKAKQTIDLAKKAIVTLDARLSQIKLASRRDSRRLKYLKSIEKDAPRLSYKPHSLLINASIECRLDCSSEWELAVNWMDIQTNGANLHFNEDDLKAAYPTNQESNIQMVLLKSSASIFLDLLCRPGYYGEKACKGGRVADVLKAFKGLKGSL